METLLARSLYDISPLIPLLEQGYTILTPNSRLARRVSLEWNRLRAASGDRIWEAVAVMPVQAWLEQQWQMAVARGDLPAVHRLEPAQLTLLWRQVIAQCSVDHQSLALLQPDAAADSAAAARDVVIAWQAQITQGRWRSFCESDPDCAAFLIWLECFEQRLQDDALATSYDCIAQLMQTSKSSTSMGVALLECADLPPLYESALEHMCSDIERIPPRSTKGQQRVYAFENHTEQLQGIADWVAAQHAEDAAVSIGVVLTDMNSDRIPMEYQLRRAFNCLGENYVSLPVNFSTGTPLAETPVVRDGLLALAFGRHEVAVPDVVKIVNSRFFGMTDLDAPVVQRFITELHDDGTKRISSSALRVSAAGVKLGDTEGIELGSILMRVAHLRHLRTKALPGTWADYFSEVLEIWGWPGIANLDTLEYQQVVLWHEVLESMNGCDAVSALLDYSEALSLLQELARKRMSQPETAESNIQILGQLEAVGLQFDHLWLVGMQAARWPEPPRPNPFLPASLQNELGMPRANAQREWEVASGRIDQYSRAVKTLHAGYCSSADGVAEAPSPVLADFAPSEIPVVKGMPLAWLNIWHSRALESVQDDKAPAVDLDDSEACTGGSGLLEDQSQCPFRAFAKRRLKISPLGDFTIALSPAERGAIVHDALYALWGRVVDHSRLVALNEGDLAQLVADAAHVGLSRVHTQRHGELATTYWTLERSRLETLLMEWLELERSRTEFVVRAREQKVSLELAQLKLELRIDRIDQLPDGSQVIMDYKSSASSVKDWMGPRPAKPQLLLYGVASPGNAAGLAFAQLRLRECKFVGLGESQFAPGVADNVPKAVGTQMSAQTWAELNEQWSENLRQLAQDFVDGQAQVDPLAANSCAWCGLDTLCRVNASNPSDDDEGSQSLREPMGSASWE